MSITAQQASEQAADQAESYLRTGARRIDEIFGEGFARSNPSLVGQFAISASIDYLAWSVSSCGEWVSFHAEGIDSAIGELGSTIGAKLEGIRDNIPVV